MLTEAIRRIFCLPRSSRQSEVTAQPDKQDAPTPTNDAHSASNGVPPNTLAVGSVWDNFESLMQAMCEESRKQTDTPLRSARKRRRKLGMLLLVSCICEYACSFGAD